MFCTNQSEIKRLSQESNLILVAKLMVVECKKNKRPEHYTENKMGKKQPNPKLSNDTASSKKFKQNMSQVDSPCTKKIHTRGRDNQYRNCSGCKFLKMKIRTGKGDWGFSTREPQTWRTGSSP